MEAKRNLNGFLERSIESFNDVLEHTGSAARTSEKQGLIQSLDPRLKLCGAAVLIFAAVGSGRLWVTGGILLLTLPLFLLSRIPFRIVVTRAWITVLCFTGAIALPAVFLTPGLTIARLPLLHWPITAQGAESAFRLILRAEATSTVALLLVLSTPWPHLLKALRIFQIPILLITILGMTHRYIFLLLQQAREQFMAQKSRQVGTLKAAQRRQLTGSSAVAILSRSIQLSEEVYLAMQARGFNGEIRLLDEFCFGVRDWIAAVLLACLTLGLLMMG